MTRSQRWLLFAAGIAGVILFAAGALYWATAATGHPRVKHTLLFVGLAGGSALVAWFALPAGIAQATRD